MSNLSQAGNQYRRIKSQCLPLFDLAAGRSEDLQESVYRTMVLQIAAVLDVEALEKDLSIIRTVYVEIAPDISGFRDALANVTDPRNMYAPGGRVQPPQFIDPNRPSFARYDYAIPA